MITTEHLVELGKDFAARGGLSSPMLLIEYSRGGRGLIDLSDPVAEGSQTGIHKLGWQAARDERQTGRVEQVAVIAAGWIGRPEPGLMDSDRQQVLIISSWVKGSGAEHIIYHLEHPENDRVELSSFDPQPDRIESPAIDRFIDGYRDGQAALKREIEKDREREY
jgi:hypothetical protein